MPFMQTSTQPELAHAAAQAPGTPVTITTPGPAGTILTIKVPATSGEVQALVDQRSELSDQLANVNSRRQELSSDIRVAPVGASRTGLEDRIKVLDQRIIQLENDLASTGRLLAAAPRDLVAFAEEPRGPQGGGGDFEEGMAIGGFFTGLFLVAVYAFRRFRRRRNPTAQLQQLSAESNPRMERLENGMEAIAI
ncbi:MAG: hypothetical protein ABI580_13165, partial [Burkholderiaceae bacterium]